MNTLTKTFSNKLFNLGFRDMLSFDEGSRH